MKNNKVIFWLITLTAVVSIGLGVFFGFFYRPKLTIQVEPKTAKIEIGEFIAQGELKATLKPESYELKVTLDDYLPLNETLSLKATEKKTLNITLRQTPSPTKISDHQVQFMVFDSERESLLYLEPVLKKAFRLFTGDLNNVSSDEITPAVLENIKSITWSPDRGVAFYRQDNDLKLYDFKRYDLVNQETHDWPDEIGSVDWRPDGQKVAYYFEPSGGERTLIRANRDNSGQERIFNFGTTNIKNPQVFWGPNKDHMFFLTNKIYFFDVFTQEVRELKTPEDVQDARWLPNEKIIYRGENGRVNVIDSEGIIQETGLDVELNRITATKDYLVVALNRGSSLEFKKVSLVDFSQSNYLLNNSEDLFPTNLLLNADESVVFFTSGGNIYYLRLEDGRYRL